MTIIEKTSDRGHFIYEAVLLVINNNDKPDKRMDIKRLQWELFQCGVYIKKPLLEKVLSEMLEKKLIGKNEEAAPKKATSPIIQP